MFIVFEQNPQLYSAEHMFRLFEDAQAALGHAAARGFVAKTAGMPSNDAAGLQAVYDRTNQKVVSCATGPGASVYIIKSDVQLAKSATDESKNGLIAALDALKIAETKLEAANQANIALQGKLGDLQAVNDGLESKLKVLQNQ